MDSLAPAKYEIKYSHHAEKSILNDCLKLMDSLTESDARDSVFVPMVLTAIFVGSLIMHPVTTVQLACVFVLMVGLALWSGSQLSNTSLHADEQGLILPFVFFFSSGFKLQRQWSELRQVYFTRNNQPSTSPDRVCLSFDNGHAALNLSGLTREDLERLLLLIQTYTEQVEYYPDLKAINLNLTVSNGTLNALSFTGLWHEELDMRLGSTAYVPLDSSSELQNGRIRVAGQIAMSGLSAIYLVEAEQPDGVKTCVLKEAALPAATQPAVKEQALELFQREARLLSSLSHPRIVRILDYFVENNRHYLLMDYLEGQNLRTYILEHGSQNETAVRAWAMEMAEIVGYLHELEPPVVHRDLTPDNFILEKDGSVSLIDFGAANTFIGTVTGTMVGKTAYMPIEQFKGKATLKSDIYSLGCTIYFLLTGRDPDAFAPLPVNQLFKTASVEFADLVVACTNLEDQDSRPSIDYVIDALKRIAPAE